MIQRVAGTADVLAVLSAVSTDAATATEIFVFCVVCAWALSFQTTLIYAWRRSTSNMPKEESGRERAGEVWRKRSLNGGVLCVCFVYFRFCIAIFLAERFAWALPLHSIFTYFEHKYWTFTLLSSCWRLLYAVSCMIAPRTDGVIASNKYLNMQLKMIDKLSEPARSAYIANLANAIDTFNSCYSKCSC